MGSNVKLYSYIVVTTAIY